ATGDRVHAHRGHAVARAAGARPLGLEGGVRAAGARPGDRHRGHAAAAPARSGETRSRRGCPRLTPISPRDDLIAAAFPKWGVLSAGPARRLAKAAAGVPARPACGALHPCGPAATYP